VPKQNPSLFVKNVTRRIAEERRAQGLTQEQMAERLRMATKNYQRIEYGQNLTLKMLARIANALDVRVIELLDKRRG
jgi:transcriptional regulator with XRE-family HTH domain